MLNSDILDILGVVILSHRVKIQSNLPVDWHEYHVDKWITTTIKARHGNGSLKQNVKMLKVSKNEIQVGISNAFYLHLVLVGDWETMTVN